MENPDVNFLLVTDCDVPESANIHVRKTSLEEEKARYEKVLGMKVAMPNPYKLCDFRPAYGILYADELKGFDFWGHSDIDLVLGQVRHFLTEDLLASHDMISCWGHLCLYRNNEFMNNLFKEKHEGEYLDWQEVFTDPKNRTYDEAWLGTPAVMRDFHGEKLLRCEEFFDDVEIQDTSAHFRSFLAPGRNCLTFIHKGGNLNRVFFDKHFHRHVEPTMYAHFQKRRGWAIDVDDFNDYIIYPNVFRKPFRCLQALKLTWLGSAKTQKLFKKHE